MKNDAHGNPYRGPGAVKPLSRAEPGVVRRCANGCPTILNSYNLGRVCLRCAELGRSVEAERDALVGERVH
jgi:hypothetical protein